ncbi:MAG TPA: uroporphyrinogen decarboxylase family protein [Prolixibacteraceae bacterium]|nr:uroporphyrinogen decarboxylase family protein [Prolixibacteraceae bacterium]HPS12476.1 uroporphyrinogen decarboxylase family protein [Prolixibacteraceae bacterium]
MTDQQWNDLLLTIQGERKGTLPTGFIIDCPWLPKWYGISILDYFTNDELWLKANLKALETFPDVMFLPGFWSEYGMCTEPSAFGAKSVFWKNEFPFAEKVIHSSDDIDNLEVPNPETDGLLPFMLNRLKNAQPAIEAAGHKIRFSVSRGPLNVASFLMGTTELMTTMMMEPDKVHKLLRTITDFLKKWHRLQRETIPTIDGMLMLDDIVGFVGEDEFLEFGYPYLKELYDEDVSVKFFHNDADCTMSVKYYPEIGINLYNPGLDLSINEIHSATENKLVVLGSLPPRDVLAACSPEEVYAQTKEMIAAVDNKSKLIASSGGGMPPNVSSENIEAFIKAAQEFSI